MGVAVKGGMYCERCEQSVAAQKTTHGVRNTAAVFTYGMAGKIEDWHCPNCGGKAVPNATAKHRAAKKAKADKKLDDERMRRLAVWNEITEPCDLLISELPNPSKKPNAWGSNALAFNEICRELGAKGKAKKQVRAELEDLPFRIEDLDLLRSRAITFRLREKGVKVETIALTPPHSK
jgi:hypothetical protein